MSRFAKFFITGCAVLLLAGYFVADVVIPSLLQNQIKGRIENDCRTCRFEAEHLGLELFPTRLVGIQIHFEMGNRKTTYYQADVPKLTVDFSLRALTRHLIRISRVHLKNPKVVIAEGDRSEPQIQAQEEPSEWNLEIDGITIRNGGFTYQKEHLGKTGSIHISAINGEIGPLGSTPSRRNETVHGGVTASLEKTGKIDLKVLAKLHTEEPDVVVNLGLDDMDLASTSRFFEQTDSIEMKGAIQKSTSTVKVYGKTIHARTHIAYRGLELTFHKNEDRGPIKTLLANLFAHIKPAMNREKTATLTREEKEPLVGWIFRGLKEAAIKVARD